MTLLTARIQTAAPGVGACCGAALVTQNYPVAGLLCVAASLAVYAYVHREQ